MPTKVIQWGAGYAGAQALRCLINNPAHEVVGVKCFTAAKEGHDVGEIAGLAPTGIAATRDAEALLATDADVVLFMPRDALAGPSVPSSPHRRATKPSSTWLLWSDSTPSSPRPSRSRRRTSGCT